MESSSAVRILGSSESSALTSSSCPTRIDAGATPSNSWANLIRSDSSPFLTRCKIGSIKRIASLTSNVARGSSALYCALVNFFPRKSTVRITFKL